MKIQGTVIGTAQDYKATLLIVEYREADKIKTLAVRCYEGNRELEGRVRGLEKGEVVDVVGSLGSREAKGRWYTAFEAQAVTLVKGVDRSVAQPSVDDDLDGTF
jgi:hypothetical protein